MKTNHLDQFYTSKQVVNQFLKLLKKRHLVAEDAILIEPSAGAFIN